MPIKIKTIEIENVGPVERLKIELPFTSDGLPKPLVLVGENGSGKTTTLSFIVDSLLQFAQSRFDDVLVNNGTGNLFYRVRNHDIRIGATTSSAYVAYDADGRDLHYLDRSGHANATELRERLHLPPTFPIDESLLNEKVHLPNSADPALLPLRDGAYIFFPNGRRETPYWFQQSSLDAERYSNKQKFGNKIYKRFVVETAAEETSVWIMDGLLDDAVGYTEAGIHVANELLRLIVEDTTAHFAIAPRHTWPRVQIFAGIEGSAENPRRQIIPSLAHLSAGQSMLLGMFGTIANHGTLRTARKPSEIEGIVVIDEIEVYLHTHLQRRVLPKLIKLFPKIQFVMTTHSPTFLMGMKDEFGLDGFEIRSMPSGNVIDVDNYSEIGAAVDALKSSTAFRDTVSAIITRERSQPLLVVEGKSDAHLIDAAWRGLRNTPPPFRIMTANGRRALRYLLEDSQFLHEVGEHQCVLGLFDFDEAFDDWNGCRTTYPHLEGLESTGLVRRHKDKLIYAGLLPVPEHRALQAGQRFGAKSILTIELLFPDEVIGEDNLSVTVYPGDIDIKQFAGDKVKFAERMSSDREALQYMAPLLTLIACTLRVS